MAQYSFPVLDNEDLLPCLEEMEMPLTAAQLAKPTYEIVAPLFESILINLTGITREDLNQPVFAAIDCFEFPELHDESIAASNFFRHLNHLLQATGVKDFSLKDLFKPESIRLRRQLSAIVNFAKFREEKLVAYTEMQARIDELAGEAEAAQQAHDTQAEALQRLKEERAAEEEAAAGIRAEAAELHAGNQSLNKTYSSLHGEIKALKAQANALADQAQQEKFAVMNAQQEQERLQDQVVQSPEKFQALLAELAAAVESERGLVEAADRRCRDLAVRREMVGKVEKEVVKCLDLMKEVEVEIGRKKAASAKVKGLRAAITSAGNEAAELEAQQQHLKRQMATLSDRIRRLESQAAVKREAVDSSLAEQQRDQEAALAEGAAQDCLIAQHEATVRELSEQGSALQAAHQKAVAAVLERYYQLRSEVSVYNATLEAAMGGDLAAGEGGLAGLVDTYVQKDQLAQLQLQGGSRGAEVQAGGAS